MTNANSLNVHDINISDTTGFTTAGGVEVRKRLSFWVGSHGPFTKEYPSGQGTEAQIKVDIDAQVLALRNIESAYYGSSSGA